MTPFKIHRKRRGGPPPGTSARWRLLFPFGNAGAASRIELNKVELVLANGGADQCVGGVATSSTVIGGNVPANAFDANGGTYFQCFGANGDWLEYQFPTEKAIRGARVIGSGTQTYWNPEQIVFQFWDGSAFVTAFTSPSYGTTDWGISIQKIFDWAYP